MVEAVLFDFDGTLVDSSPGIFHTALYSVRELGVTRAFSQEELSRFIGPPLRQCFRAAFNLDASLIEEAVSIYREEYDRKGRHLMDVYPGMREVLSTLRGWGIKLGVATYKGEPLIKLCLEETGLAGFFSSVHGSDAFETRTKKDIVALTVKDLEADAAGTYMVGDTVTDMEGAEGAGVNFIGVTYGFGFKAPDTVHPFLTEPKDLIGVLRKIKEGEMNG